MVPVIDVFPQSLSKALLQQNIRFVEQFLSMMRKPGRAEALAEVTGRPVEELQAIVRKVEADMPDLNVPEASGRQYGLGAGKRADWERAGR